jgi:hypothetical protein
MAETQFDRVENMLKVLIQAQTTIDLTVTSTEAQDKTDLANAVKAIIIAPAGV